MGKHSLVSLQAIFLLAGCLDSGLPSEPHLDSSINGNFAVFIYDQRFVLELDVNADAGYRWECEIGDTTVVRLDSASYRPKDGGEGRCGGLAVETFYFRTFRPGRSTIKLSERRVWEENTLPINTIQFVVVSK